LTSAIEGLLYIIAGLNIGIIMEEDTTAIHTNDIWKFFVFYFFIYAIRLIVMCITWPIIRMQNPYYSWKELFGMTWGGLRGVMSIIFALIVKVDVEAGNARFRDLC